MGKTDSKMSRKYFVYVTNLIIAYTLLTDVIHVQVYFILIGCYLEKNH